MRTAIYTRLSKDRKDETSTERQEEACRQLAQARGWEVTGVYVDHLSAWNPKTPRPDFERVLADAEAGLFDMVLVWKLDRFSRSVLDFHKALRRLESAGVSFASVSDSVDTSTPMGRFTVTLTSALAELESDTISYRVRAAKDHSARAGKPHGGGGRRFGYTRKAGPGTEEMELDPAEAALVLEAVDRVLSGDSLSRIVKDWSARGIRTPGGHEWKVGALVQTLKSPHLAGLRSNKGKMTEGKWTPIITADEHATILALLARRQSGGGTGREYLLTGGLAVCGLCGTGLVAHPRAGKRNYWCPKTAGFRGCGGVQALAEPVEALMLDVLLAAVDSTDFLTRARPKGTGEDIGKLAQEVDHLTVRLEHARSDYYIEDVLSRTEWLAVKAELEDRLAGAKLRLAEAQGSRADTGENLSLADIRTSWAGWSRDQKRALVRAMFQQVIVNPVGRGRRFTPERVSLVDRDGGSWSFVPGSDETGPLTLWNEDGRRFLPVPRETLALPASSPEDYEPLYRKFLEQEQNSPGR